MFVYEERDMDIIIITDASYDVVITFYRKESDKRGWKIEKDEYDPKAENQRITLPLYFNEYPVETFEYRTTKGYIIAARRSNCVLVCRILQSAVSKNVIIVQHVRTEHN